MANDPPDTNPKSVFGIRKPPLSAIPPSAIIHLGQAMQDGRLKYGLMNWREHSVAASVYYDACMRHLMAWWDGEDNARDSGHHHLAHAMACCAVILDAMEQADEKFIDDRPVEGACADVIAKLTRETAL
jgi:hypothetical protein